MRDSVQIVKIGFQFRRSPRRGSRFRDRFLDRSVTQPRRSNVPVARERPATSDCFVVFSFLLLFIISFAQIVSLSGSLFLPHRIVSLCIPDRVRSPRGVSDAVCQDKTTGCLPSSHLVLPSSTIHPYTLCTTHLYRGPGIFIYTCVPVHATHTSRHSTVVLRPPCPADRRFPVDFFPHYNKRLRVLSFIILFPPFSRPSISARPREPPRRFFPQSGDPPGEK